MSLLSLNRLNLRASVHRPTSTTTAANPSKIGMIPVAANDVAFSVHAVLLTVITISQVFIFERGNQVVSKASIVITAMVWLSAFVCLIVAFSNHDWLWLISIFNTIQVIMTAIKYIPQAVMNFGRKSTIGWSIGNILLDLTGGILNFAQMAVQSIDQGTWVNFYGNVGKTLLSLEVVFFDLVFILQHYVLYRVKEERPKSPPAAADEHVVVDITSPLVKPSDNDPQESQTRGS